MRRSIDFTTEDFLSAGNCKDRDLLAQFFFCPIAFRFDFGMALRNDFLALGLPALFFFVDNLGSAFLGLLNYLCRLCLGFPELLSRSVLGKLEVLGSAIRGRKPVRNAFLSFFHRMNDGRPNVAHRQIDKDGKRDHLADKG